MSDEMKKLLRETFDEWLRWKEQGEELSPGIAASIRNSERRGRMDSLRLVLKWGTDIDLRGGEHAENLIKQLLGV